MAGRAVPITHPDAALLVEEVQEEYVVRYGGRDETPIDPTYFEEPAGAFFVGYLDDVPVVTGANLGGHGDDVEVADEEGAHAGSSKYVGSMGVSSRPP